MGLQLQSRCLVYLDLPHEPTCFMTCWQTIMFWYYTGQIMRFGEDIPTYDGQEILAVWDMGYHNFGADWIRKFIQHMFISLLPMNFYSRWIFTLSTDRNASMKYIKTVSLRISEL